MANWWGSENGSRLAIPVIRGVTSAGYGAELSLLGRGLRQRRNTPTRIHGLELVLIGLIGLDPVPDCVPVEAIDGDTGHEADPAHLLEATSVVGGSRGAPPRRQYQVIGLEVCPVHHPVAISVLRRIAVLPEQIDRKGTRLNSSHLGI